MKKRMLGRTGLNVSPIALGGASFGYVHRSANWDPWSDDGRKTAIATLNHGLDLGINYIGVCCGASPMLVREVAEAVGKSTEASRFSENMHNHFMYGDNKRLPGHIVALGYQA